MLIFTHKIPVNYVYSLFPTHLYFLLNLPTCGWMSVPSPKFICWHPTPQCDSICRWRLCELIRSQGWSLHIEINALIRRDMGQLASLCLYLSLSLSLYLSLCLSISIFSPSLPDEDTRQPSANQEAGPHQTQDLPHLELGLHKIQNSKK